MSPRPFSHVLAELEARPAAVSCGRIVGLGEGLIRVRGLSGAALGDAVRVNPGAGAGLHGEIIKLDDEEARVLCGDEAARLELGQMVLLEGHPRVWPDESWLGRVLDPYGLPLDGRPLLRGRQARPLFGQPLNPAARRGLGRRMETGLRLFDTILPLARGQRLGLFAGAGVGKSSLLGRLAHGVEADVVVFALVGERGRELSAFRERILGPGGMRRSVIVAATADAPALARRRCLYTAMAVAEHFRDAGRQVLLLADSVTRFAEAHREIAIAAGEPATMRGFPPSTSARIMGLCERAGTGTGEQADITAIFTVLVAGSDMDEPVADMMRGVLDGHVVLDREIAERGRFPAVDIGRSVSRALPDAATEAEMALITEARALLAAYARSETMIRAGLHAPGADPVLDRAVRAWPLLEAFATAPARDGHAGSFAALRACLEKAGCFDTAGGGTDAGEGGTAAGAGDPDG